MLARVAGRSPLEYFAEEERERQKTIVVAMLKSPPERVMDLAEEFAGKLRKHA
jgi:hypothetical protein